MKEEITSLVHEVKGVSPETPLLKLLPPFYQIAMDVAVELVENEGVDWQWTRDLMVKSYFDHIKPVVGFLTKTRSMDDFRIMQEELIKYFWLMNDCNKLTNAELKEKSELEKEGEWPAWITWPLGRLVSEYRILSSTGVHETLDGCAVSYRGAAHFLLDDVKYSKTDRVKKGVTLDEAVQVADSIRSRSSFEGRVGYITGKFRRGVHQEHIQLIEKAKLALGKNGILIVGLESSDSIRKRRGPDHFTLPNETRIAQMAALRAVDYVLLHDPKGDQLNNLELFYEEEQKRLKPNMWFIGTEDYHWRQHFEKVGQKIGSILLWDRPVATITTTNLFTSLD